MFHDLETTGSIHPPHNWEYADAAARVAATGFVAADVKKLALQLDDYSLWMLTATTPTWTPVGNAAGVTATGSLASAAIVLGNGGVDAVTASGLTTDGTSRVQLGESGVSVGGVELRNATSGTLSIVPATGALGTTVIVAPATSGTIVVNPMTTAGDSIVGGASGVPTRLALGSALQVRRVNAAGTAEEFATASGGSVDIRDVWLLG